MRWTWAVALTMGLSLAAHDVSAATSQRCEADPQQLFLAAVDSSLRQVVKK